MDARLSDMGRGRADSLITKLIRDPRSSLHIPTAKLRPLPPCHQDPKLVVMECSRMPGTSLLHYKLQEALHQFNRVLPTSCLVTRTPVI